MAHRIRKKKKPSPKAHFGPDGSWRVPISDEMEEFFKKQDASFKERFGRDAGPHDPVFFDPDADGPGFMSEANKEKAHLYMIMTLATLRADAASQYAFHKTGIPFYRRVKPLTDEQRKKLKGIGIPLDPDPSLIQPNDMAEWEAAYLEGLKIDNGKMEPTDEWIKFDEIWDEIDELRQTLKP